MDTLELADKPLFTQGDIVAYDWDTHEITFTEEARRRVPAPNVLGLPFVIVVDHERILTGAFWTGFSSYACPVPVIRVSESPLVLARAFPSEHFASGPDPRSDPRIRQCLMRLGKLKGHDR